MILVARSLAAAPGFTKNPDGIVAKAEASGGHGNSGSADADVFEVPLEAAPVITVISPVARFRDRGSAQDRRQ